MNEAPVAEPGRQVVLGLLNHRFSGQTEGLRCLGRALERAGWSVAWRLPGRVACDPDDRLLRYGRDRGWTGKLLDTLRWAAALRRDLREADALAYVVLPGPEWSGWLRLFEPRRGRLWVGLEAPLIVDPGRLRRIFREDPSFYLPRWILKRRVFAQAGRRRADRWVVGSRCIADGLLALGVEPSRVHAIPAPVDPERCRPRPAPEARAALGLAGGFWLGYLGHSYGVKGLATVTAVFQALQERGLNPGLAIAWSGEGPDPGNGLRGLSGRVRLMGRVHPGTFYSAVDVLLLPYRAEFGTTHPPSTVLEAMTCGVPLLVSDVPPMEEWVQNDVTGWRLPPDDRAAWEQAVLAVRNRPEWTGPMREHQRRWIDDRASDAVVARAWKALAEEDHASR